MSHIHAEQNLRLANQMLDQQAEINELRRKLAAIRELVPAAPGRPPGYRYLYDLAADIRRILDETGDG